jgi:hypothetical protein
MRPASCSSATLRGPREVRSQLTTSWRLIPWCLILLRGELFGVEENGQRVIAPVAGGVGAGSLDCVSHTAFGGKGGCVDPRSEVDGNLDVSELHRCGHAVNRDIRGPEGGPHLVPVAAESAG